MNARLLYLTIAMLGSAPAPTSHKIPAPYRAVPKPPATTSCGPGLDNKNVAKDSRCFELRIYTIAPGGAADVLHARFRERTIPLFRKHGMTVIGFWQPIARPDQLVYMLAFRDAAARDSAWASFNADPEWIKAHSEMRVSVDVENTLMVATDYSTLK